MSPYEGDASCSKKIHSSIVYCNWTWRHSKSVFLYIYRIIMITMVYSLRICCAHRVLRHFDRREFGEISNGNPSEALLSWIPSRQRCRPNQHMKSTKHVVSIIVWPAKLFLSVKPSTLSIVVGKRRIQNEHFCQSIAQYCKISDLYCLSDFCLWSVILSSAIPLRQLMFLGRKFTRKNNVHILIALSLRRTGVNVTLLHWYLFHRVPPPFLQDWFDQFWRLKGQAVPSHDGQSGMSVNCPGSGLESTLPWLVCDLP